MYLGIDIGTSGVKSVVVDEKGDVAGQGLGPLRVQRPKPLFSEQLPEDWWTATEVSVLELPLELRAQVRAIGLSGQMHGATFLDGRGEVLCPAILWNDGRSAADCAELERREPRSRSITGNLAMPGFTAPKALWLARHEPQLFERVDKVLLPKDYVRFRLSNQFATDVSDAAGTLWLDVAKRRWSDRMLEICGLSTEAMPLVYEGTEITGHLTRSVAQNWGMKAVPVIAGGGDNAAGAVGVGVARTGDAFLSLGTSGVLFVASEKFRPHPERGVHAFCHALPNRWHEMTVMLSAASCLDWAAKLAGIEGAPALVEEAGKAKSSSVPIFLPYLSGERTPHNNPHARGALFGMDHGTGPAELARAVLEGVAFGLADGLEALESAAEVETITVIGGGSRSVFWGQILASALNKSLCYRHHGDVGPALGAAKLARLGIREGSEEDVCSPPPIIAQIDPDPKLRERFLPAFERYRALYETTSHLFSDRSS